LEITSRDADPGETGHLHACPHSNVVCPP
jgi:hypothetical protein